MHWWAKFDLFSRLVYLNFVCWGIWKYIDLFRISNFKFLNSTHFYWLLRHMCTISRKNGASFQESVWQYKPRCCNAGNHWTDRLGKIKTTWWAYPSWEVSKWRYTRRLRWQVSKVARTTTGLVVERSPRSRVIQTVIHSATNQATVLLKILPTFDYMFHTYFILMKTTTFFISRSILRTAHINES